MSEKRRVPCQTCGNLPSLRESCSFCNGAGSFLVDDERGDDPNRYGPGGAVGPKAPSPGMWASATAPVPEEPEPQRGVPVVSATKSGSSAEFPRSVREQYME